MIDLREQIEYNAAMKHDPLHVPNADLVVMHQGEEALVLNKQLLDRQLCWKNLEQIKKLHQVRLNLEDAMRKTRSRAVLRCLDRTYTELEYVLQDMWKFDRDADWHRFWTRPQCKCPVMDNMDAYPYRRYISGNCPLHGGQIEA